MNRKINKGLEECRRRKRQNVAVNYCCVHRRKRLPSRDATATSAQPRVLLSQEGRSQPPSVSCTSCHCQPSTASVCRRSQSAAAVHWKLSVLRPPVTWKRTSQPPSVVSAVDPQRACSRSFVRLSRGRVLRSRHSPSSRSSASIFLFSSSSRPFASTFSTEGRKLLSPRHTSARFPETPEHLAPSLVIRELRRMVGGGAAALPLTWRGDLGPAAVGWSSLP